MCPNGHAPARLHSARVELGQSAAPVPKPKPSQRLREEREEIKGTPAEGMTLVDTGVGGTKARS